MKTVLTCHNSLATSLAVSHVGHRAGSFQTLLQRGEASLVETISNHFQRCWFPPEELGDQRPSR